MDKSKLDRILDFILVLATTILIAMNGFMFLLEIGIISESLITPYLLGLSVLFWPPVMNIPVYTGAIIVASNLFRRRMIISSVISLFLIFLIPKIDLFFPTPAIILLVIMAIVFYWSLFRENNKQKNLVQS